MDYNKIASLGVAIALTSGLFVLVSPPALGKALPLVVTAPANVVTRHISYADLNLATSAGELTLNRRVGRAVSGLCQEATGDGDGNFMTAVAGLKCSKSAWGQARPQIAQAVTRSRDVASTSVSPIAAAAITIDLSK